MNKTFITPIDREDIHDRASALDDILDTTEAIADSFVLYKIPKPTEKAIKLADIYTRHRWQWGKAWTSWAFRTQK